jgi:hypothetical protein
MRHLRAPATSTLVFALLGASAHAATPGQTCEIGVASALRACSK